MGPWVSFISKLLAFFFFLHVFDLLKKICFPLKCLFLSFLNSVKPTVRLCDMDKNRTDTDQMLLPNAASYQGFHYLLTEYSV